MCLSVSFSLGANGEGLPTHHHLLRSIRLHQTTPPSLPLTLAWDKLDKQEVRRPGTSRLPSNGPLVPREATAAANAATTAATDSSATSTDSPSPQARCFGSEFRLTLFLPPEQPADRAKHNEAIIHLPVGPPSSCNEFFHAYRAPVATRIQLSLLPVMFI